MWWPLDIYMFTPLFLKLNDSIYSGVLEQNIQKAFFNEQQIHDKRCLKQIGTWGKCSLKQPGLIHILVK